MAKAKTKLDLEYELAVTGFRPEFGNLLQIRAIEWIKKVDEAQKKVDEKLKNQEAIKKASMDLAGLKRQVVFMLKGEKNQSTN